MAASLLSSWDPKMEGSHLSAAEFLTGPHTMSHMDRWNVYTHLCERPGVCWSPGRSGCRSGHTTTLGHSYSGDQVLSWRPCSSLMSRCRGLCCVLIDPQGGVSGPANFRRETMSPSLSLRQRRPGRAANLLHVCPRDAASLGL